MGKCGIIVSFPVWARNSSFHQSTQTGNDIHPVFYSMSTKGSFLWMDICQGMKLTIHLHLAPGLRKNQVIPSPSHALLYNEQGQLDVYAPYYLTNIRNVFPEDKDSQEVNLPFSLHSFLLCAKTTPCSDILLTSSLRMQKTKECFHDICNQYSDLSMEITFSHLQWETRKRNIEKN
jgi:hypothetical protein